MEIGLQRKTGAGIQTQEQQPYPDERTTWLWQSRRGEPHSFGEVGGENHMALAEWGPCGGDTANGAGSLNHGLLLRFLRHGTPGWAEGEGRTVHLWVF